MEFYEPNARPLFWLQIDRFQLTEHFPYNQVDVVNLIIDGQMFISFSEAFNLWTKNINLIKTESHNTINLKYWFFLKSIFYLKQADL